MKANAVSIPLSLGFAAITGEALPLHPVSGQNTIWLVVAGGAIAYALPTTGWRAANLMSQHPGINTMAFMIPVASVMVLATAWNIHITHWDFFAMGTAAIVLANLLNFRAARPRNPRNHPTPPAPYRTHARAKGTKSP